MKLQCNRCKTEKPTSDFQRDRSSKSGYQLRCRECQNSMNSRSHYRYREARVAQQKEYRKTTQDRDKAIIARAKARRLGVTNTLTPEEWLAKVEEYQGKCAYCLTADYEWIDHVVPFAKGGPNEIENVVPACKDCNQKKYTKLWTPHPPSAVPE